MKNYKFGKIYKILGNGYTYIGSTCMPLVKRLNGHIYPYNRYKKNIKHSYISNFKCFEDENIYNIILLENFPCNNKNALLKHEAYYIKNLSDNSVKFWISKYEQICPIQYSITEEKTLDQFDINNFLFKIKNKNNLILMHLIRILTLNTI